MSAASLATLTYHSSPPPQPSVWQVAASALRSNPAGESLDRLDTLYATLLDPETGEPDAGAKTAALQPVVEALHEASQAHPNDKALHRLLGEYLMATGFNGSAVTELRAAYTSGVPNNIGAVPLAQALLRSGRMEDLLELPDRTVPLLLLRARAQENLGRYADAVATLKDAIAIEPDNATAIGRLGLISLWHGDRASAAALLDRAIKIAPGDRATLRLQGEYTYVNRDFAASAAAYDRLIVMGTPERSDPTPPSLGKARAEIYLGDLQQARATLDHARLSPADPAVVYYRALLAFRAGDFQRAGELAEPLDGELRDFPPLHLLIGLSMLATGNLETAHNHLLHYVTAYPGNSIAQTLLVEVSARLKHADWAPLVTKTSLYAALGFAVP